MARTRRLARLWPFVGALCAASLAQAAQQRSGQHGYQCLLANGAKFYAMDDVSELFPQAVRRCAPARVPTVSRGLEGKEPRIIQEDVESSASAPDETIDDTDDVTSALTPAASTRREAIYRLILEASWRHELDPELVQAVIHVESAYQPHARSPKGALGLMQVMPATGARYGVLESRQLLDPALNIEVGARYLSDLYKLFNGRTDLILAAYNAGEGAVARYGNRVPPYPETREYVRRALQLYRGQRR